MSQMTYQAGVTENRDAVVLELRQDEKALARIILDAPTVHDLIRNLAKCRAALLETIAVELDPGARIEVTQSPAWRIPDKHSGSFGTVLALRHPGMGWLGFVIEPERAQQIGQALIGASQS